MSQFLDWFHSDADCWAYLARLRWADGFSCPRCGPGEAWISTRHLYICSACQKQTSVLAGTIFEKTRLPLLVWFRAIWFVTASKGGVSAKELQRELGIGYRAAWLMLHKLRLAMKRPGRDADRLSGDIEVDESYLGGPSPGGKRGRGAEGKLIIAIAAERLGFGERSKRWALGRTRLQVIENTLGTTLLDFVEDTCEKGSTIYTDGLRAYNGLSSRGYIHDATAISKGADPAHVVLPAVHRVASLLKRWLMGTHHGGIGAQHAEAYLDEFVFRFNRRHSKSRGLLFYRLLQNAVIIPKQNYELIVLSRRSQAGKRRGIPKVHPYSRTAITNTPTPRRATSATATSPASQSSASAAAPASASTPASPASPAANPRTRRKRPPKRP
jgi:transposase-like protein